MEWMTAICYFVSDLKAYDGCPDGFIANRV